MGTITATVDDKVEKKFRGVVKSRFGTGKGKIGQAITQAMSKWIHEVEQEKIRDEALAQLEKGYHMGKILYKHRSELYDRGKNIH